MKKGSNWELTAKLENKRYIMNDFAMLNDSLHVSQKCVTHLSRKRFINEYVLPFVLVILLLSCWNRAFKTSWRRRRHTRALAGAREWVIKQKHKHKHTHPEMQTETYTRRTSFSFRSQINSQDFISAWL